MTTPSAFDAIENGDQDAFTAVLDAGTDPNASDGGITLLMWSVVCNKLHMVDVLLSRGANVHQKASFNWTALHAAATAAVCDNDVFPVIFLAAGPRAMNFPSSYGWTPLHYLARYGRAEQMAFALSYPGIDVSIRNHYGHTPLDVWADHRKALQTYSVQEARWQPMRYSWIKFLMIPTRQ
jgi:ankyrin repeat protein